MRTPPLPPLPLRGLHLAALSGLAVAQPLFDLLGDTPEFFVVRGSERVDVIAFALVLTLAPPLLLLAAEVVAGLVHRSAAAYLHLLFVAGLTALLALQALKRVDALSANAMVAAAVVLGVAAAALYARAQAARSFLTLLAAAPALFTALFLVNSPIAKLSASEEAHAVPGAVGSPHPVIFVVLDELAASSLMDARGRLEARRYPAFGRLARDGIWFRNATTVHEHTTESVPAMLDGKLPVHGRLPLVADHPDNLFTMLGDHYRLRVFEPVTQLCPERLCPRPRGSFTGRMRSLGADLKYVYLHVLLPERFTRDLPSVSETWQNFGGDEHEGAAGAAPKRLVVANDDDIDHAVGRHLWSDQRAEFEAFLAAVQPARRPTLYFAHLMLPHAPWRFLPSGRQYTNALGIDGLDYDRWTRDRWLVAHGYQRHLLQVGFVDRLLGRLLDRLQALGIYDDSLIVVTADHGLSFQPGGRRRSVSRSNLADIANVTLFVKPPGGGKGRVDDRAARTVDILPTIADALEIDVPWRHDGVSLLSGRRPPRSEVVVREREGGRVAAPLAEVLAQRRETLARKARFFANGLYAVGPNPELVGRRVATLPVVPGRAEVALDGATLLRRVDPRSALVPSHLTGTIAGADGQLELAIAIGGRIESVARTFGKGDLRFSTFVPERALRPGENDVEIFAVRRRGGRLVLERLRGQSSRYALAPDRRSLRLPDGRVVPVERGSVKGHVEDWFLEKSTVRLGGWAADVSRRRAAERVVAFSGNRFLDAGTPAIERIHLRVATEYGITRSGFAFELPRAELERRPRPELRFYAISGGVASPLSYAKGFPWRPRG